MERKAQCSQQSNVTSANPDKRGYGWEVLDFDYDNIDESLAAKLTDDDIGALLVCIDAKNKLKMMNMKKLPQVVGYGLKPLMGSKLLAEFNVSRMYYSSFCKEEVVPVLDSILSTVGNDLEFSSHRTGVHLVVAETYLHNIYPVFIQQ